MGFLSPGLTGAFFPCSSTEASVSASAMSDVPGGREALRAGGCIFRAVDSLPLDFFLIGDVGVRENAGNDERRHVVGRPIRTSCPRAGPLLARMVDLAAAGPNCAHGVRMILQRADRDRSDLPGTGRS